MKIAFWKHWVLQLKFQKILITNFIPHIAAPPRSLNPIE